MHAHEVLHVAIDRRARFTTRVTARRCRRAISRSSARPASRRSP
jgi:hypothetical protein